MKTIRHPAVAGMFYPADPQTLRADVESYLAEAAGASGPVPKALIAPHAGYIYSGPVAGHAYARLRAAASRITRVVLMAPAHRWPFHTSHGVTVYVDPKSLAYLDGTELDYAREGLNEGFKFNNPNVKNACGCGESFNV